MSDEHITEPKSATNTEARSEPVEATVEATEPVKEHISQQSVGSGELEKLEEPKELKEPVQQPDLQKTMKPGKVENQMRKIGIDKVVVNIGVGEAGDKLIKAEKVIDLLTHRKSIQTISQTTNRDFGIRKQMPIGCKVTIRGEPALKFLEEAFWVKDNRIPGYSFDLEGNFSFGIPDYTEFRNMKYDPEIGIFGMDISVTMKRPGHRISIRRIHKNKIPKKYRITRNEAKQFIKTQFKIEVIE